jgi:DNA-binding MarR family transcriptional regulator
MEEELDKYFSTLRRFSHILMNKILADGSGPKLDLKFTQLKVLAAIKDDRPYTVKELAENSMIKLPNMTPIVDALIKDRIAKRQRSINDRRKTYIRLTEKGEQLREQFLANRRSLATSIFSKLSKEKKQELLTSLDNVCKILECTIKEEQL